MSEQAQESPQIPEIDDVRVKFTQNCTRIGELVGQIANLESVVEALVAANHKLQARYMELQKKKADGSDVAPAAQ